MFSANLHNGWRVDSLNSLIEDLLDPQKNITCKQYLDRRAQNGVSFNNFLK